MKKMISILLISALASPMAMAAEKSKKATPDKPAKTVESKKEDSKAENTAPQASAFKKGDKMIGFSASYMDTGPVTSTTAAGSLDLFIKDNLSVGGAVLYNSNKFSSGAFSSSSSTLGLAARVRLFLPSQGMLIPYVGGGANLFDDDVDSYLNLTGEAGLMQPLADNIYITYSANYWLALDSDKDNTFMLTAGLQIKL